MDVRTAVEPGVYRHFKGNEYEVVGVARHSETEEELVVYRALYGDNGLWVRPLGMFCEKVDKAKYPDSDQTYRFERIADADTRPRPCAGGQSANADADESVRSAQPEGFRAVCEEACAESCAQEGGAGCDAMVHYADDELAEAKRQIDSLLHKLEATLATLESKDDPRRYKSQITLARRRIRAFEVARGLISNELG